MRFLSLALLLSIGCSEPSATETVTPRSPENPPQEDPVVESDPPEEVEDDLCASLREQTSAILAEAPVACTTADDCECYPAFIDCGGVAHESRTSRLAPLAATGQAEQCGYRDLEGNSFNCAPWACTPDCQAGLCVRQ